MLCIYYLAHKIPEDNDMQLKNQVKKIVKLYENIKSPYQNTDC